MFERYTERARRVLFFSRSEAVESRSRSIETQHILLGLLHESKGMTARIFEPVHLSKDDVLAAVPSTVAKRRRRPGVEVEVPFSTETKRVLGYAAEEADRLMHNYIGTEHLILGLLREKQCLAARILNGKGLELYSVRADIVTLLNQRPSAPLG
jgi:ATP-dependent Clp protease ATP-binding subunit ClpC